MPPRIPVAATKSGMFTDSTHSHTHSLSHTHTHLQPQRSGIVAHAGSAPCNALQHTATHCNTTLQRTQHTATSGTAPHSYTGHDAFAAANAPTVNTRALSAVAAHPQIPVEFAGDSGKETTTLAMQLEDAARTRASAPAPAPTDSAAPAAVALQEVRDAMHCNTLQHTRCNTLPFVAAYRNTGVGHFNLLQLIPLQHSATHCNALQHTATHCNTLQHT